MNKAVAEEQILFFFSALDYHARLGRRLPGVGDFHTKRLSSSYSFTQF